MAKRGVILTIFAALFVLLAISNFPKPLHMGNAGFVFLGTKTSGVANMILGPLFGVFLLIYVIGIWRMRSFALPMGIAYGIYVPLNMVLFTVLHAQEAAHGWHDPQGHGGLGFMLVYMVVELTVAWGAPLMLWSKRSQLG